MLIVLFFFLLIILIYFMVDVFNLITCSKRSALSSNLIVMKTQSSNTILSEEPWSLTARNLLLARGP